MRRNEEMMREENSRFQKEIDDKQAESKEFITALEELAANLEERQAECEKIKKELDTIQEENAALEDRKNLAETQLNSHLLECGPKIKNFKESIYNIIREFNVAELVRVLFSVLLSLCLSLRLFISFLSECPK